MGRPPRNIASSTSMCQSISVRIARSCAGALRAVTSAVRMRMPCAGSRCSRCSAASSGLNGPGASGVAACVALVALEGVEPVALEDALGLVGEQHRVAVEGDAHFVRDARRRPAPNAGRRAPPARRRRAPSARRPRWSTGTGAPSAAAGSATGLWPRVNTPRSIGRPSCCAERKTRMPETGSLRDRITTSTARRRRRVEAQQLVDQREGDAGLAPARPAARAAAACRRGRRWPRRRGSLPRSRTARARRWRRPGGRRARRASRDDTSRARRAPS